jgi:hypothetical protein
MGGFRGSYIAKDMSKSLGFTLWLSLQSRALTRDVDVSQVDVISFFLYG